MKRLYTAVVVLLCMGTMVANSSPQQLSEATNALGNSIAVWQEVHPITHKKIILASTKDSQSGWNASKIISNININASQPIIALNEKGNAVVAWLQQDQAHAGSTLIASTFIFGGFWTSAFAVSNANENVTEINSLNISEKGKTSLTAIWTSLIGKNSNIRSASAYFNEAWSYPVTLSSQ